jgi:hypothetical protein
MSEELWYVKLANGDVHRVTLDQLDGAFQAGHIDENTMVLSAGTDTWTTLADLLGGGDEQDEQDEPAAEASYVPQHAAAEVEYVPQHAAAEAQYIPQVAQPSYVPQVAQPSYIPQVAQPSYVPQVAQPSYVPQAAPVARAPQAHAPYASPQTPVPYVAPAPVAPVAQARQYVAPVPAYAPNTIRPLSMDLGDASDFDLPVRKSSKKGLFVAVIGLAAIAGGVGFVAQKASHGSGGDDIASVAAAAAMAAPPPAADPVLPTPTPAPAPAPIAPSTLTTTSAQAAPSEGSPLNPSFTTRFNETTKQKLLANDKAHDSKAKARHSGGAPSSGHPKSQVFTTGGNKYDPLNSSI